MGLGGFGAEPGQVQQGAGEGLGGFGAEPCPVQQGSGEGSSFGAEVRFNRVLEKVRKKFLEKVPEKVCEALVQSQVRFNRICGRLIHGNHAEVFPALGFAARFRRICKNKTLRLLGIPQKLIIVVV